MAKFNKAGAFNRLGYPKSTPFRLKQFNGMVSLTDMQGTTEYKRFGDMDKAFKYTKNGLIKVGKVER